MAIPILNHWQNYFTNPDEGLGSSYERIILNKKLETICKNFRIKSILEAPSFGFTGLSGINSMQLAKSGLSVTVLDNDEGRAELVKGVWQKLNIPADIQFSKDFASLQFADSSFDLSWNFSALWFVNDIRNFLSELSRVTSKVIVLAVPNRTGLGYLSQKMSGAEELKNRLNEEYIKPKTFLPIMKNLNWNLIDSNFIDCPPWPDIGMSKDKFLKKFGIKTEEAKPKESLTILDFYSFKNPDFEKRMLSYYGFEKMLPKIFKTFWAHHKYFLFVND
jgi:SAM-dependent methyltransferase